MARRRLDQAILEEYVRQAREIDKRHAKRMGTAPKLTKKTSKSGASTHKKSIEQHKSQKSKDSGRKSMRERAGKTKRMNAAAA
jgi:hypothetical protein